MKISAEHYRGIYFVRISALPEEQKKLAWASVDEKKIIKILRHDELLKDCIQYTDYQKWYDMAYRVQTSQDRAVVISGELKLAFE